MVSYRICIIIMSFVKHACAALYSCGAGSQGVTPIISYICRLGSIFGFKILNFNILGFSEKIIFWAMKELRIFWGSLENGTI